MSGFAIFSVLGYMSQKQGVDIATVAESGMDVSLKRISVWLFYFIHYTFGLVCLLAPLLKTYRHISMKACYFVLKLIQIQLWTQEYFKKLL